MTSFKMPDLPKKLFDSEHDISVEDAKNLAVGGDDAVSNKLSAAGWNGGAVCFVVLSLSPANDRVEDGFFAAKGLEDRDLAIAASKVWQDADMSVNLVVRMPALENFRFRDGGLTSDLLASDQMIHFFNKTQENGQQTPILTADIEQFGIGKFCLRLVCHPSSASGVRNGIRIKYHVMLFPGSTDEVAKVSQHTNSSSWPGIRLGEGEMPFLPRATKSWGCPVLAFLKLGKAIESGRDVPKGSTLRSAIASIMVRCGAPDAQKNGAALTSRWEKWRSSPGDFIVKPSPMTWPTPVSAENSSGDN